MVGMSGGQTCGVTRHAAVTDTRNMSLSTVTPTLHDQYWHADNVDVARDLTLTAVRLSVCLSSL